MDHKECSQNLGIDMENPYQLQFFKTIYTETKYKTQHVKCWSHVS
jgi:hypothetical protein